ncbi:MAG: hypothetical protein Q9170_005665 [Blastenia crenularia]
MDDLSGLSWTPSGLGDNKQKPPPMNQIPNKPSANDVTRSKASTPANDSFANLVAFNAANPSKNLSLLEQQKKLREVRATQQLRGAESQVGEDIWEKLGSGTSTPIPNSAPPRYTATEDYGGHKLSATINKPFAGIDMSRRRAAVKPPNGGDLLSGLDDMNGGKIDGAVHTTPGGKSTGIAGIQEPPQSSRLQNGNGTVIDDDDPFGLGSLNPSSRPKATMAQETANGEDDILGLLGRPVSEFAQPQAHTVSATEITDIDDEQAPSNSPADRALAELVEMGFAPEKSRQALESTGSGPDVQAAVGWLLNQAHQESRSGSRRGQSHTRRQESRQPRRSPPRDRSLVADNAQPAWMKNTTAGSVQQSRQSSRSPVNGEKDASKIAAELGTNLFKTANSLWKTGAKKLNQAVADLNSDSDSSQPKWMKEPRLEKNGAANKSESSQAPVVNGRKSPAKPQRPIARPDAGVTDEALMLESVDARPPRKTSRSKPETIPNLYTAQQASSPTQPHPRDIPQPKFMQQSTSNVHRDPRSRISKQAIEEQTAEAYISPARRKRIPPKPAASEPDLLFDPTQTPSNNSLPATTPKSGPQQPPRQSMQAQKSPRPEAPKRTIPSISSIALRSSHTSRQAGTAAFKRGDYAEATTHYTSALSSLPPTHPLFIPILTNRALSHLKTGDPKACIADTNSTLDLIGSSRGVAETVDLGDEGVKDLYTYWGKAMTRQAEALEQLEKWAEAGGAWKSCVEAGVGGGLSIEGRNRCEKAIGGPSGRSTAKPTAVNKSIPKPKPRPQPSALDDLSSSLTSSSGLSSTQAVSRLRAANLAADRLDDEKFALSDQVSDRVSRWRAGKEGNLRALLASLDTVLWEGSGWKKVGMGELIQGGKVKVVYMRGIARVHPDKLPTTATTEQRMISAAVFATLNEAWDGFRRENGL